MKFWDMIDVSEDKNTCWEWKSKKGTFLRAYTRYKGKSWNASRLAWFLINGEIPDGLIICHKCDNPPCCNPNHLFLGTFQDNVDDRERKGRNKTPHCLGEDHGGHKLTESDVREIRKLYQTTSHNYYTLSEIYGVCFSAIRNVIKGRSWGWLK